MKKWWTAVLLALLLTFVASPAFAQVDVGGEGDRVVFGQNVTIEAGEVVEGSLVVFGGNVVVEEGGRVRGDAVVFGGAVRVAGKIGGNVVAIGGMIRLESSADVGGDVATAGGNVIREKGARVGGEVLESFDLESFDIGRFFGPQGPRFTVTPPTRGNRLLSWLWRIVRGVITALAVAALGLLVVLLLPEHTRLVSRTVMNSPLPSLGVGVLAAVVFPLLVVLLVITCVGILLTPVVALALVAGALFGWIAIALLIGEKILEALKVTAGDVTPLVAVVVGSLLLSLLSAVPCLGFLLAIAVWLWGLGAVVLTRFGTRPYQPAVAPAVPVPVTPPPPPVVAEPLVEEGPEPEPAEEVAKAEKEAPGSEPGEGA